MRFPLGTNVLVTHLDNGKTVIFRITDRGITNRRDSIDLCKEAAAKLDMLREGSARVRLEIMPDKKPPVAKSKTLSCLSDRRIGRRRQRFRRLHGCDHTGPDIIGGAACA